MATPEEVVEWLLEAYQAIASRYRKCLESRNQAECLRGVYNQLLLLCRDYRDLLHIAESHSTLGLSIVNNITLLAREVANKTGGAEPC